MTLRSRSVLITVVAVTSLLLSSCATLPSSSEPQALRSLESSDPIMETGPIDGQEPDLLLRDFYAASANPTQQYQQAKSYLTPSKSKTWTPSSEIIVLDRIDMSSNLPTDADEISYTVTGTIVGTISDGGPYNPRNDSYKETVRLEKVDDQWRITDLPNHIAVERTEMRNRYVPQELYFFDPTGNILVADRRWIFSGINSMDSALISLVLAGPSAVLEAGVADDIPVEASFTGVDRGAYQLTGLSGLSDDAKRRLAAQLVWTLALADITGPYTFHLDGEPIKNAEGSTKLTVDDFPEYNPQSATASSGTMYALTRGKVSRVTSGAVTQVPGFLGDDGNIESFDVSAAADTAAAVVSTGDGSSKRSSFHVGSTEGNYAKVLEAATMTKPTFEPDAQAVWTVADGTAVKRIVRNSNSGEIAQIDVDTTELGEDHNDISVLRLSATGVRAAFIINGRVYTATVSRPTPGERKLTNVRELAPVVGDSAITVEWTGDSGLLVGTASADTPIWRVEADGSTATTLPSGNIVAPVVSVASNSSTVFITDARAALQLGNTGQTTYWREVPGLEGGRSITVVPR